MQNLTSLRRNIRAVRRSLSRQKQLRNSLAAAAHFHTRIELLRSKRIAVYLAADGELDPQPLTEQLRHLHKKIYLPILRPIRSRALWFSEYQEGDRLVTNRFGIAEPDLRHRQPIPPWGLDLIILPLVAFSDDGTRTGMGGGYYDRTLAYRRLHDRWQRPRLIGYAHECQHVPSLPRYPWDIPLDGIITEWGYRSFASLSPIRE